MMPSEPVIQEPFPGLISTGVQELVRTAGRLGLIWNLRIGTVTAVTSINSIQVRLDGDTDPISVVSMMGTLFTGVRVYVISVPPAGNFAVGAVSRIYPGLRLATATRDTSSAAFTAETVTDTVTASLIEGRTYTVNSFTLARSTVAADRDLVRVREDSISGTLLRSFNIFIQATGADFGFYSEVLYTAVATGDKTFVLSGARASGTGNITHTAGTSNPVYLYVEFVE